MSSIEKRILALKQKNEKMVEAVLLKLIYQVCFQPGTITPQVFPDGSPSDDGRGGVVGHAYRSCATLSHKDLRVYPTSLVPFAYLQISKRQPPEYVAISTSEPTLERIPSGHWRATCQVAFRSLK